MDENIFVLYTTARDKELFLFQNRRKRLWGLPNLLFIAYRGSFPGVKLPGREDYKSSPSSGVKNR